MIRAAALPMLAAALALLGGAASAPANAKGKPPQRSRPPSCADRSPASPADPLAEDDFGCATALNLRLMAVDPQDLTRGKAPAAASADLAMSAVRRLREGQVKALNSPAASDAAVQPQGAPR